MIQDHREAKIEVVKELDELMLGPLREEIGKDADRKRVNGS